MASAVIDRPFRSESPPYRLRWYALAVVLAAECMDLLDGTILNVAMPSIRDDLGGSYSAIQWIIAAYALAFAVGLITGGRLGDVYGRRRMFLLGTAGFTLASGLCAVAPSVEVLIGCRVLQGAAAAIMIPQGLGLIRSMFPREELPAAFGVFGPVIGLSAVLGPILGGFLVHADLLGTGWRAVFLVNLPLGVAALFGAAALLPEARAPHRPRLDLVGTVLAGAAMLLLVYPLVQGRDLDWPGWVFFLLAAAVPAVGLFAWQQRRRERLGLDPLVTPSLLGKRAFMAGAAVILLFFAGMIGLMLTFMLYLQLGLGYSALHAGLTLAPWSLGTAIGAGLAGAVLAPRYGRHVIHAGLLVMAAGIAELALTASRDATSWSLTPGLALAGIGMGLALAPVFDVVLAGVEDHELGSASGLVNALQQLGGGLGIAIIGTLFFSLATSHASDSARAAAPTLRAGLTAHGMPAGAQPPVVASFVSCVHDRAAADDPSAEPSSCRKTGSRELAPAMQAAGAEASARDFSLSMRRTLWVEVALLAATFGLGFLLPRRAREGLAV
jgi:EmrB/QacA subfamily drug resistance transporter